MRSLLLVTLVAAAARADGVSFRNEVMPVLARAGCNAGACHGNLNGKGGFKLSLRGEQPGVDLTTITRDQHGRRVDLLKPDESLLLKKATGRVPHEGGPRFAADSNEYRILRDWIVRGCGDDAPPKLVRLDVTPSSQILFEPERRTRIAVNGTFSDGSRRDLTALAVFEPTTVGTVRIDPDGTVTKLRDGELTVVVRYLHRQAPVTLAFLPPREKHTETATPGDHPIDRRLWPQWNSLRLTPSAPSDDGTFVRRAFLDALGILPTADEARAFLDGTETDKRTRLIDALLARPEFADFWAQKWSDLLRNEEKALDRKGVRVFHQWIRDAIAAGTPMTDFAKAVVSARGSTYENPPANFYRSLREPYARAESVAQVFLGVRLQCAKCHNHPFDRWTQDDYHEFAAFFGRIDYRLGDNGRKDKFDKNEFIGEQWVTLKRDGGLKHPRSGAVMRPRLLDQAEPAPPGDPLRQVADWIAGPASQLFAKAQANRVWFHLFGRGLVEPSDDFRASNPGVNDPLLDDLTKRFTSDGYDLRKLVRFVMTSQAYQLSSSPGVTNADDETHFSKALVQPLEAEQLLDAVSRVTGSAVRFDGYPRGTRAGQVAAMSQDRRGKKGAEAERFLKSFGKPERLLTCECERSEDVGMSQAFQLLTGGMLQEMLTDPDNCLTKLSMDDAAAIDELYLSALARRPTDAERKHLMPLLAKDRRGTLEDLVWGLVNSKEFLLRR